jgi:hypothetical protein
MPIAVLGRLFEPASSPVKNARFYFTEAGWDRFGRAIVAAARESGQRIRVLRTNEEDVDALYRDEWQVMVRPKRKSRVGGSDDRSPGRGNGRGKRRSRSSTGRRLTAEVADPPTRVDHTAVGEDGVMSRIWTAPKASTLRPHREFIPDRDRTEPPPENPHGVRRAQAKYEGIGALWHRRRFPAWPRLRSIGVAPSRPPDSISERGSPLGGQHPAAWRGSATPGGRAAWSLRYFPSVAT